MNNLARIVSHGFAIIVVILLGIGFIYRGELFPDLELPDFLVPESEKVAGAGAKPGNVQQGMEPAQETVAGAAANAVSPRSTVQSVPVVPAVPPVEAPSAAPETEAGKSPSEAPGMKPRQVPPTETASETAGETRQPVTKAVPPPATEGPGPGEGAAGGVGEAAPGTTEANVAPVPAPPTETPAEPQIRVPSPATPPFAAETPSEPATAGEAALPAGSAAPTTNQGMAGPGSSPVTATQPPFGGASAGQPPRSPSAGVKPYELLAAAREAFWLHNYDDAEKNYHALIELEPQDPDAYGELGNMFFSQGRWEEAAAAYYEAGVRLVKEGRPEPARELVNVIRGLNGKQADDLEKLLSSAATSGNH
jgi:tetratricopeptide repeat protein